MNRATGMFFGIVGGSVFNVFVEQDALTAWSSIVAVVSAGAVWLCARRDVREAEKNRE